jgi:uncharacterized repeat protein (TIGR01451 family)
MATADLTITVDDSTTSVVPGTDDTYTITVTNNGPDAVTGASVSDLLPAGVTAATWMFTGSTGSGSVSGPPSGSGALATTVDLPQVGDSVTFTFTAAINPSATGTIDNTATVSLPAGTTDTDLTNNSATDTDALTPEADLAITKTDGVTTVVPGSSDTYTIIVSNNGSSTAVAAPVTDIFPAAMTAVSWTAVASAGSSVGAASGVGNINTFVTLLPGGAATFTAVGQISSSATGSLANTASVATPAGATDPDLTNNDATDTDILTATADLSVSKTVSNATPNVGDTITYTVTLSDQGPDNATNVVVTDLLPAGLTFVSATPSQGAYSSASGVWTVGTVSTSVVQTLIINATVASPDALTNTGTISFADQVDPNTANNTASATETPQQADLSLSKSVNNPTPNVGETIAFIVTLSDLGPDNATGVQVFDLLPAGLTFAGATTTQGTYSFGTGFWDVGTVSPGGQQTLIIDAVVDIPGALTNTAAISHADQFDPDPTNNSASATETQQADLSVTITDAATTLVPGTSNTYTITVTNNGTDPVSSFNLIDTIPDALLNATFGSPSAGSYDPASGLWSALSLGSGQSVFITLSGVIGIATGTLSNTVTVSPSAGLVDTNPGNNVATDSDTLVLFSSPYPPPPPATSANMILRRGDGLYAIYDIGNNATLDAHPLAQVGSDWQFAGFNGSDPSDMMLRNSTSGAFQVYDVSDNNITGTAALGAVGLNWQVAGFGNFSSSGETDMMLRDANTGGFQAYDIANNQITGTAFVGTVGLDWQVGGFGNFSSRAGASDMILRNTTTGGLQVYNIDSNQITGTAFMGTIGLEWQFSGFGNFSSMPGETGMIMRNANTGALVVYDIANNQITGTAFLGTVGLEWQFAGVAPVRGAGTADLVLRNVNTGAFEAYNIANNQIVGAASLGHVGLEWSVGGFAADPPTASTGSAGATAQLVQAMAAFGGGSGTGESLNTVPLSAETSQQPLLTQPHA